jgi:hypothetical protein
MKRDYGQGGDERESRAATSFLIQQCVRSFAKDAEKSLAGRLAAKSASCPDGPVPPTGPSAFTFGTSELLSWVRSGIPRAHWQVRPV